MSASREVFLKVVEVLQNKEIADKMNQSSGLDEAFEIANVEGVSKEDFILVLKEIKESEGKIELSEEELDLVAGGAAAAKIEITISVSVSL